MLGFSREETNRLTGGEQPQQRFSYGAFEEEAGIHSFTVVEDEQEENAHEERSANNEEEDEEEALVVLTRRVRCLFSVITWPIVPLGTIVTLALIWLLYAAFLLDIRQSCSHPLHWYAAISLLLVAYAPYHTTVRARIFGYIRERDGPTRPPAVRRYDQIFHTISLLYVYGGITLVQTCRQDLHLEDEATSSVNSCAATCPNLFLALSVYVATLELFTLSLIVPLLFLPCIYLWFLRQATSDVEALAVLQERLREEDALLRNNGVTADEIMETCCETVKLVYDDDQQRLMAVPVQSSTEDLSESKEARTKECCICMSDFCVQEVGDIETGANRHAQDDASGHPPQDDDEREVIVRTVSCGHLFHQQCIASWVGGRWTHSSSQNNNNDSASSPQRRARRTTCPLCRRDLRPSPT